MTRPFPSRTAAAVVVGGALLAMMTFSTLGAPALAGQQRSEAELLEARESLLRQLAEIEAEMQAAGIEGLRGLDEPARLLQELQGRALRERELAAAQNERAVQEMMARAERERQLVAAEGRRAAEELMARSQRERERAAAERRHVAEEALRAAQERERSRYRVAPRLRFSGLPMRSGGSIEWILAQADDLELTDDQVERLRDARRAHRRASIERDAAIEVAELDLAELLEDEADADLGAVRQTLETISSLRVEERIADLQLTQDSHAVLTPEQREQLEERQRGGVRGMLLRRDGEDGPAAYWFGPDDQAPEFEFHGPPGLVFDSLNEFEFEPFGDFEFRPFGTFRFGQDVPFGGLFELLHERHDDSDDEQADDQDGEPDSERSSSSSGKAKPEVVATL